MIFELDMLDADTVIVNVKLDRNMVAEVAEADAEKLADDLQVILNSVDNGDTEWVVYSEPNYWLADGTEADDIEDLKAGDIIQWCIYQERRQQ